MSGSNTAGRLSGHRVVVTGTARGIGRAIALGLAAEGAAVGCLDIDGPGAGDTARLVSQTHDVPSAAVSVDLADEQSVHMSLAETVNALGPLDTVVVAAGGAAGRRSRFLDLTLADWGDMQQRNVTSAFLTCSVFGQHLVDNGRGSIVLITSSAAEVVTAELAHYCAAKGAVRQLMRAMSLELAPLGVRVNAVAPGTTATPGNADVLERLPPDTPLLVRTPMGRFGKPAEIVGAVVYLASGDASYTTGTTIAVDGGFTAG